MNTFKYTSVCSRGVPGFCKTVLRFFINPHLSSLPRFDDFLNIADGITFDIVFILQNVKNLVRQPDGQQFLLVHAEDSRSRLTSRKKLSDFQLSTNSLHQNDCYCRNNTNFAGQTNKFCKYLLVEIYDKIEIK